MHSSTGKSISGLSSFGITADRQVVEMINAEF